MAKGEKKMNQAEIGKFIAERRKEKKLTQAQLAEKLNITDRAVSKWETGKSMPDSSIMLELCEILGITVNELLSGEKVDMESLEKRADENLIALKRKDENNMARSVLISVIFSMVLFVGIMVCLICNLAVSGQVTWSLIPVSSIVFAWLISFPGILFGKKGIRISLISFSIFLLPYLFLLGNLVKVQEVFSLGAKIGAVSIVFLWVIAIIFGRIRRKTAALGTAFLSAVPFVFVVNIIQSNMIGEPVFDVWDLLTVFVLLMLAAVSFLCDYAGKKGLVKK